MTDRYPFDVREIVEKQNDMITIIDAETANLTSQTNAIDDAVQTKNRIALIAYSANKRSAEYNKIMIIVLAAIIVSFGVYLFSTYFPFFPPIFIGLILSVICSVALIWSFYIFIDIQSRSKINYDELNTDIIHTNSLTSAEREANLSNGDLLGSMSFGTCIGQGCCAENTLWNSNELKCMIPCNVSNKDQGIWTDYLWNQEDGCYKVPEPFSLYEGFKSLDHVGNNPTAMGVAELAKQILNKSNKIKKETNNLKKETNTLKNQTNGYKNQAGGYKNQAGGYKNQAFNLKNQSIGIRNQTNNTYNKTNTLKNQTIGYKNQAGGYKNQASNLNHMAAWHAKKSAQSKNSSDGLVSQVKASNISTQSDLKRQLDEVKGISADVKQTQMAIDKSKIEIGELASNLGNTTDQKNAINSTPIVQSFTTLAYSNYL